MQSFNTYTEHFLILASTITGCTSNSAFASLLGVPIGITKSTIGLKIGAITAVLKSISQKLRKRKRTMIK